jgi:predicted RNase H-like HicB family nuclease
MNELNDLEFSIVQALEALGGEADIGAILERVEASPHSVRRALSRLSIKEDLIKQRTGTYTLAFTGRERFLNELRYRHPESKLLKQDQKRKRFVYTAKVQPLAEGGYLATCDAIPGCLAEGVTVAEALLNLEDGAVDILKFRKEHDLAIQEGGTAFDGKQILEAQLVVPLPE